VSWIADGLLEQAEHLLDVDPGKPKQASLRRAVSAAYYSLFHLLGGDAGEHFLGGPYEFRRRLVRIFDHGEMKGACKVIVAKRPLPVFGNVVFPPDLALVAETFIDLQEARHRADYDVTTTFTRHDSRRAVARARDAFDAWRRVRKTQEAYLFLMLLLGFKKLEKR